MKLKEYISYTFQLGVLEVYEHGKHTISQPFDSATGEKFKNQTEAEAWLIQNYPNFFTPT